MKIGIGITTYNAEHYFKDLYDSLPLDKIDELVVVNGGKPYKGNYKDAHWIQHKKNYYPSVCRNDNLRFLQERDCDYYITLEDDMVIKDPDIFEKYIEAAEKSKIGYFCFASTSWGSGEPGNRTPAVELQYSKDVSIGLYPNMCNEFTFKTKECLNDTGLYDNKFRYIFDVENVYRISKTKHIPAFWYFPDIKNSDDLIMNHPETQTRINEGGARDKKLSAEYKMFFDKHNDNIQTIPKLSKEEVKNKIYENSNRN